MTAKEPVDSDGPAAGDARARGRVLPILRRMLPRYSLLSLMLFTAALGSAAGLWMRRQPCWLKIADIEKGKQWFGYPSFSPDGRRILAVRSDEEAGIWSADSGALLLALKGPKDSIDRARFSPDGLKVLTVGHDSCTRLWDADTGRCIRLLEGFRSRFSPDGSLLLAMSSEEAARVYDVESWKCLFAIGEGRYSSAAFSPDGKRVALGGYPETTVLDAGTGARLCAVRSDSECSTRAVFSPDGRILLNIGRTEELWDAASGRRIVALEKDDADPRWAHRFSADGMRIAACCGHGRVYIWDAGTGKCLVPSRSPFAEGQARRAWPYGKWIVLASSWPSVFDVDRNMPLFDTPEVERVLDTSPDGSLVATSGGDGSVRLWNAEAGMLLTTLKGDGRPAKFARFSHLGNRILTGDGETARVWETFAGRSLLVVRSKAEDAHLMEFSPVGDLAVIEGGDRSVAVWDVEVGGCLFALGPGLKDRVSFSSDGKRIVSCRSEGEYSTVRIHDSRTGRCLRLLARTDFCWSATFSPRGARVLVGYSSLWDADSGECLAALGVPIEGLPALSPDGRELAAETHLGLLFFDAKSGRILRRFDAPGEMSVAYSPDGKRIATGGDLFRVRDTDTGELLRCWAGGYPWHIRYLPDGKILGSGGPAEFVDIFDPETGLRAHEKLCSDYAIVRAAFSPCGKRLFYRGDGGGSPGIYDTTTDELLATLEGIPNSSYENPSFSPDGERLVIAFGDVAQVWQRRRPEWWWGIFWLPLFWITLALAIAALWSLRRDAKTMKKRSAGQNQPGP